MMYRSGIPPNRFLSGAIGLLLLLLGTCIGGCGGAAEYEENLPPPVTLPLNGGMDTPPPSPSGFDRGTK